MSEAAGFTEIAEGVRDLATLLLPIVGADTIADALIVEGLAVWGAQTGRKDDAIRMLALWVKTRDNIDGN